ncbi:MAG: hypothetical protein AB1405_10305 [Bdellovibrionota bacterium]
MQDFFLRFVRHLIAVALLLFLPACLGGGGIPSALLTPAQQSRMSNLFSVALTSIGGDPALAASIATILDDVEFPYVRIAVDGTLEADWLVGVIEVSDQRTGGPEEYTVGAAVRGESAEVPGIFWAALGTGEQDVLLGPVNPAVYDALSSNGVVGGDADTYAATNDGANEFAAIDVVREASPFLITPTCTNGAIVSVSDAVFEASFFFVAENPSSVSLDVEAEPQRFSFRVPSFYVELTDCPPP